MAKEFRYLWILIVKTAVYQRFSKYLCELHVYPFYLAKASTYFILMTLGKTQALYTYLRRSRALGFR